MPLVTRYSNVSRGALTYTGNTLGFSSFVTTTTGIGAFLSTTTGLSAPGYPTPSTLNWQQNGSTAVLNLPPGSTVLYAELVWGGSTIGSPANLPVATLDTPITFKTPLGINTITFDPATAFQSAVPGGQTFYTRSQNVTALVQAAGAGTYEVDGVPAVIEPSPSSTSSAGWTLSVAYSNSALPYSDLIIYVGNVGIAASQPPVDTTITGFSTPTSGPINARVLVSAMEGDIFTVIGDQIFLGPDTSSLMALSGPNNIVNNFFASQINNDAGLLDTSGSFGTLNQNPNGPGVGGLRQGWDITNVNGSSDFVNSQTQAVVRLATGGDTYAVSTLGVQIQVQSANLSMVKTVDKAFGNVGDILTYTINLTNNGAVDADNVVITDPTPSGTTLVPGSVTANVPFTGSNPQTGITLTNSIPPSGTATISYQVIVGTTIPSTNPVTNMATANYTFTSAPGLNPVSANNTSNTVATQINHAELIGTNSANFVKSVDKAYADVGEVLTYSFTINNTGNVTASNIVFTDPIPSGTSFVGGSVVVNGGSVGGSPATGIAIPSIPPGGSATVRFQVTVTTIPTPNPIPDTGTLNYQYIVDPGQLPVSANGNSNTVTTQVNNADLIGTNSVNFVKSVDKTYADIGDVLTYSFTVRNTGNVAAINTGLTDPIPNGTTFVTSSVLVNGVPSSDNPVTGISIPSIPAGGSATVSFKVTVNTIPSPNPIPDTGTVNYQYIVDPTKPPVSATGNSNTVTTQANHADLIGTNSANFVKSVDKSYADVGDVLTYSFTVNNTGNTTATNVVLTDTIPGGTTLVSGSVLVNGVSSGDNPTTGINIPSVPAVGSATVSFKVTVNTIPTTNPIPDTGSLAYKYTVDPSQPPVSAGGNSNTVTSQVNNADLIGTNGTNFVKSADKAYGEVGSTITYTYTVKNTGNTLATNIILTDPVPTGTSFVSGSTTINGLTSPDSPLTGINVPNILPGATATVSFKVLVNQVPVPNPTVNIGTISYKYIVDPSQPPVTGGGKSNEVKVKIEAVNLQVVKNTDKTNVLAGEVITYSTVLSNSGTVTAQNVIFTDPIPSGTTFVTDSVTLNGVPKIGANPSSGVNVGNIGPGSFVTVAFKVTVNTPATVSPITNQGKVDYQVQIDPNGPLDNRSGNSNTTTSNVQEGKLTVVKTVDQNTTKVGSTLNYTISVINTGTVPVQNAVLTDTIPSGTTLVENSVNVNGVQIVGGNLNIGINLGTIPVGGQSVVTFKVLVATMPCPPELINQGIVNFKFNLSNRTETFSGASASNGASTDVGLRSFKQISVDGNLTIPSQKPDAEDVLEAVVTVEIVKTEIIKTPIGESYEGQTLTGWKAIIYGKLREKVRYVADEPTQSVHGAHFDVDFTTFIVLPNDFKKCCPISIVVTVEDIYVQLIDKRTIFKNITLLIEAKVCS